MKTPQQSTRDRMDRAATQAQPGPERGAGEQHDPIIYAGITCADGSGAGTIAQSDATLDIVTADKAVQKIPLAVAAAAPELLQACKALLVCIGSFAHTGTYPTPDEPEIAAARAAIARAEGRTP